MIKVKLFLQYRLVTLRLNLCMSHVEGLLSDSADKISKFHFFFSWKSIHPSRSWSSVYSARKR